MAGLPFALQGVGNGPGSIAGGVGMPVQEYAWLVPEIEDLLHTAQLVLRDWR